MICKKKVLLGIALIISMQIYRYSDLDSKRDSHEKFLLMTSEMSKCTQKLSSYLFICFKR